MLYLNTRTIFALILTVSYYFLLLGNYWGLGVLIVQTIFAFSFLSVHQKLGNRTEILFYLVSAIGLSVFLVLRSFEPGRFITVLLIFALNTIPAVRVQGTSNLTLKTVLLSPFEVILRAFEFIGVVGKTALRRQLIHGRSGGLLVGGILASILVIVFLALFSSADPVFGKYVFEFLSSLPPLKINFESFRVGIHLIGAFAVFSALLSLFKPKQDEFSLEGVNSLKLPITIATVAVSVVIALFLVVQAQYLLVGVVKQPNLGYRIDHAYIVNRLSEDVWVGWRKTLEFYEANCQPDSFTVMHLLDKRNGILIGEKDKQKGIKAVGAWNLSKQQAFEFLQANYVRIHRVKACYKPEFPS